MSFWVRLLVTCGGLGGGSLLGIRFARRYGVLLADPWYLLVLGVVPLAMLARRFFTQTGTVNYANGRTLRRIPRGWRARLAPVSPLVRIAALIALVVALARPQKVDETTVIKGKGIDIVICLDMSISMNAIDKTRDEIQRIDAAGKVPRTRFELATDVLKKFVRTRLTDRIGLVVFGKNAYRKYPLSLDHNRLYNIIDELRLDNRSIVNARECTNNCTIDGAGTVIGDAMARAFNLLKNSKSKSRVMVVITDGDEQIGDNSKDHIKAAVLANYLANRQDIQPIKVYTFLIGARDEAPHVRRRHPWNGGWEYVQRNYRANPLLLQEIARKTNGAFYPAYDERKFREDFGRLVKSELKEEVLFHRAELFPPLLWLAFLLIFAESLLRTVILRQFP